MHLTKAELCRRVRPFLSDNFFRPQPLRVVFLLIGYLAAIAHLGITMLVQDGQINLFFWFLSFVVACNTGTFFFFFMHEVIHGGVFRSRLATNLSAFLGGVPFLCSPYVWDTWHRHHHKHTATRQDTDRPAHPEFDDMTKFWPRFHDFAKRLRYRRPFAFLVPFLVIAGHHAVVFVQNIFSDAELKLNKRRACLEYGIVIAMFLSPLLFLNWLTCVLGIYLPLLVAHLICNVYILSNHFDNKLADENYPLQNSTSVFLIPGLKLTHMGFGRHVEHHTYPNVTHSRLRELTNVFKEHFPEEFREVPLGRVMHSIYSKDVDFDELL